MQTFKLGEETLTIDIAQTFLSEKVKVVISDEQRKKLKSVRRFVEDHIEGDEVTYGVNTGFGRLANEKIEHGDLQLLQSNLIRSHAFGVGEAMEEAAARLIMLYRAHVIAMGYSGASLGTINLLVQMVNEGIVPMIPSQGSVGASGDLAPLAHVALAMMGEGEVFYKGKEMAAKKALLAANLKPVTLQAKDGLTLINGTQAMTAYGTLAILRATNLIQSMDIAAALTVEGFRGSKSPFDAEVHHVRHQKGQKVAAEIIRKLVKGSKIISSHVHCSRVQDPYSLRCVPQVHGAIRDAFYYARGVVECEMNSCTDNPLVFEESGKVISGGNFHGEPLAIAMDTLSIAIAELGAISERRIEQLTNPKSGDIPVLFLTPRPGLNSGFMIPHVVASSLASENKTLAHPASVDSMPTSAGQEDHVSMGMWASRKVHQIIDNVEWFATIEMLAACQAIDLHEEKFEPGVGTKAAYNVVRECSAFVDHDRYLIPESQDLRAALATGSMLKEVKKVVGEWKI